ncbi:MAG: FAD-dependent oxidoreductase [Chloroflexota bacterium]|nr:FAD-dependent oxidoreductase [Chloroflexota bacterium]
MKEASVVVVGGSAAGPVAAITVRRHYKDTSVLLIRKEKQVMVPCGIPYIFGTVGAPDKNVIPDALLTNNGVELMIDEVTSVDRASKTLTTAGGEVVGYDKLILATGSVPVRPPIPGMDLPNVFPVWKDSDFLGQTQRVLANAKDIVIIGGGFIGAEMADECKKMGDASVTIVELLPHCLLLAMDEEFCCMAEEKLAENGVKIITDNGVRSISGDGNVSGVELQNGDKLKADAVIVGIGAAPNTELARDMELEIGEARGIRVDEYMRTSDKDIFAVGDCADKFSFFTKKPSGLRLASIATVEARIAGANVFELRRKNIGAVGVFATAFGDFALAAAGLTERAAKDAGFEVVVGQAAAVDKHPGSMPNAKEVKAKLIFQKETGNLLGGELSGGATTAEMANIIAALIQGKATADDVALFQMGTQPCLTASPIAYQIVNAAEQAAMKLRQASAG